MQCEAHELLVEVLDGLKKGQNQLYDLDREKAKEMSDIKQSVARLEESTKAGFLSVQAWQESFETKQSARDLELNGNMSKLLSMTARRRWTPKMVIALIGAIVGPSGIAAVLMIFVK